MSVPAVPARVSLPSVPVIVGVASAQLPPFGGLGLFGGAACTVVVVVAVLLAGVVSSGLVTVAVLVRVPAFFAVTTIVTVAVAPLSTVPSSQVTG